MKVWFFLVCMLFCDLCFSAEFTNSAGFGVQYAGLVGWQGSVSSENIHGRIAFGLAGATIGADVDLGDYLSIGGTAGVIALASVQSVNINYYPGGKYTEGWRFGVDAGRTKTHFYGVDRNNFVAISFGYSFK